jgi:hypothetical protein
MKYYYVTDTEGTIYGSFDSQDLASQFVSQDPTKYTLMSGEVRDADVEHDGNSHHTHLD